MDQQAGPSRVQQEPWTRAWAWEHFINWKAQCTALVVSCLTYAYGPTASLQKDSLKAQQDLLEVAQQMLYHTIQNITKQNNEESLLIVPLHLQQKSSKVIFVHLY